MAEGAVLRRWAHARASWVLFQQHPEKQVLSEALPCEFQQLSQATSSHRSGTSPEPGCTAAQAGQLSTPPPRQKAAFFRLQMLAPHLRHFKGFFTRCISTRLSPELAAQPYQQAYASPSHLSPPQHSLPTHTSLGR